MSAARRALTNGRDWIEQVRRGLPPAEARRLLRWVYGMWLVALALKATGAFWDVSWHFRWLRDDLAPPHLMNSVGTGMVMALTLFHSYTYFGVDRIAVRLMQSGCAVFLFAIPVDLLNHRINGLDITSWSWTHSLLYAGTGLMIAGVIRGWWLNAEEGRGSTIVLGAFWLFFLENVIFPAMHQEYGVPSIAAWKRGQPYADDELLNFAANQMESSVNLAMVERFALPVPAWVYPVWMVAVVMLVLVLARSVIGTHWAATAVAGAYLLCRCVAWLALVGGGFPPSAIPFFLLAGAVVVDLVFLIPMPWLTRPIVGALAVTLTVYAAWALQLAIGSAPPMSAWSAPAAAILLAVGWTTAVAIVRSGWYEQRYGRPVRVPAISLPSH